MIWPTRFLLSTNGEWSWRPPPVHLPGCRGNHQRSGSDLSRRELRPYQKEAVKRFENRNSAFFAMDMRLGKSLTCLRWLEHKQSKKTLIVAPTTTLNSWMDELEAEGLSYFNLTAVPVLSRALHLILSSHQFMLLNYDTVARLERFIEASRFDAIVLDESVQIKGHQNKWTKALLRICDAVRLKACLSGLPTPQSWGDLWAQLAFLGDGYCMGRSNFFSWRKKYATKIGYGYEYIGEGALAIKREFHDKAFVLTRQQAGVIQEPTNQKRVGDLSPKQRAVYDSIVKTWEVPGLTCDEPTETTKYSLVVVSWLRRLCGGHLPGMSIGSWKYEELLKIATEELPKDKLVVWCAFNDEIKAIGTLLRSKGVATSTMDGTTKKTERRVLMKEFQEGKTRVIVVQQKLGKYGIRLDAADTAIYFSNSYSLDERLQSRDRIIDIRKTRPLLYIDFVTKDTVEEDLMEALNEKKTTALFLLSRVRIARNKQSLVKR